DDGLSVQVDIRPEAHAHEPVERGLALRVTQGPVLPGLFSGAPRDRGGRAPPDDHESIQDGRDHGEGEQDDDTENDVRRHCLNPFRWSRPLTTGARPSRGDQAPALTTARSRPRAAAAASGSSPASESARSAAARSMSPDQCASSPRILTFSAVTERKPPRTAATFLPSSV